MILSDGQVHDVPPSLERLGVDAPLHLLLTGEPGERDRRLVVDEVPNYAMVGEPQQLTLRVEELPAAASGEPVTVTLQQDGEPRERLRLQPGESDHGSLRAEPRRARPCSSSRPRRRRARSRRSTTGRCSSSTASATACVCLLVSGQPYPELRVWRNLLKSDPAVDLVHFTILRPPEKQDGTPIRELALIAFPSRELFEVKLHEFDLVIFDRYSRRGLLPLVLPRQCRPLCRGRRRAPGGGGAGIRSIRYSLYTDPAAPGLLPGAPVRGRLRARLHPRP